jgi:hypothetical protein
MGLASPNAPTRTRAAVDLGDRLKEHEAFHLLPKNCRGLVETSILEQDWPRAVNSPFATAPSRIDGPNMASVDPG